MTSPSDDPRAVLRCGIYLILTVIGLGAALGRILAVDAVDKTALQEDRARRAPLEVKRERERLQGKGIGSEDLENRLKDFEAKLRTPIRRPFLSGNDRSRWCTVRALVEPEMRVEGAPYAIDRVIQQEGWDTIDMVKHGGHLYSSKPTLLPTLIAGEYWVIHRVTGLSLGAHPFELGRSMLVTINGGCLLLYFLALAGLVERLGTTDWGRVFVMAAGVFGTFLPPFAVVLNNHLVAAACAAAALYFAVRVWFDGERRWQFFAMAGFFTAFLAANELPAAALAAALSLALLLKAPRQTLAAYVPPAAIVALAFFGTNWIAHHSLKPAYMHRGKMLLEPVEDEVKTQAVAAVQDAAVQAQQTTWNATHQAAVKAAIKKATVDAVKRSGADAVREAIQKPVAETLLKSFKSLEPAAVEGLVRAAIEEVDLETERPNNWYDYAYERNGRVIPSHWRAPKGIDRGEASIARYTLHVLVGHHGIFSLTPLWLMSICGTVLWLRRGDRNLRELAAIIGGVTLLCMAFYLWWPSLDRNYGGMNAGFREVFWLAPAWLLVMLPVADAAATRRIARAVALLLLLLSVLSANYPTWNPWTHPWIMDFMNYV